MAGTGRKEIYNIFHSHLRADNISHCRLAQSCLLTKEAALHVQAT